MLVGGPEADSNTNVYGPLGRIPLNRAKIKKGDFAAAGRHGLGGFP